MIHFSFVYWARLKADTFYTVCIILKMFKSFSNVRIHFSIQFLPSFSNYISLMEVENVSLSARKSFRNFSICSFGMTHFAAVQLHFTAVQFIYCSKKRNAMLTIHSVKFKSAINENKVSKKYEQTSVQMKRLIRKSVFFFMKWDRHRFTARVLGSNNITLT